MDKKDAIKELKNILNNVVETDDEILKTIKSLGILLINLKIEEAHIKGQYTGISVLCDELQRTINDIKRSIEGLIGNNRGKLKEIFEVLEE